MTNGSSQAGQFVSQSIQPGDDFGMASNVRHRLFGEERDRAAGFENGSVDVLERSKPLPMGSGFQSGNCQLLSFKMFLLDFPIGNQLIWFALKEAFQLLVAI